MLIRFAFGLHEDLKEKMFLSRLFFCPVSVLSVFVLSIFILENLLKNIHILDIVK